LIGSSFSNNLILCPAGLVRANDGGLNQHYGVRFGAPDLDVSAGSLQDRV
jgi:hypothetical protein